MTDREWDKDSDRLLNEFVAEGKSFEYIGWVFARSEKEVKKRYEAFSNDLL